MLWCIRANWRSSKRRPLPAQGKEAEAWLITYGMCTPSGSRVVDAEAAIAEYEGRGQGRRGRRPRPWRFMRSLCHGGRDPPHAPRSAGTSSEDGPTPDGVGLSPRG